MTHNMASKEYALSDYALSLISGGEDDANPIDDLLDSPDAEAEEGQVGSGGGKQKDQDDAKKEAIEREIDSKVAIVAKLERWLEAAELFGERLAPYLPRIKTIVKTPVDKLKWKELVELDRAISRATSTLGSMGGGTIGLCEMLLAQTPLIEVLAANQGYNIAGFAADAQKRCKKPLVKFMIERGIHLPELSPTVDLLLAVSLSLFSAYMMNSIKQPLAPPTVSAPAPVMPPTLGNHRETSDKPGEKSEDKPKDEITPNYYCSTSKFTSMSPAPMVGN